MSEIKFLLNDFKDEDRKDLHEIEKTIKEKPKKIDKNSVFLRRFVLAMMKQYYQPKFKNGEIRNLHQKIKFAIPDLNRVVPHLLPRAPSKLDISSFMPRVPNKLNLFGDIPTPNVKEEVKLDFPNKRILNTPKPIVDVPKPMMDISVPRPIKELKVPEPV